MADATGAKTLLEVLENGAGSHPAIVTPDGPALTYNELKAQIGRLMNQLSSFGIRRNDRVAIILPNGIEAIASFLAVSGVATAAPLNAAYKPDEFQFYLEDTNARAVITGTSAGEDAVNAAPKGTFHITVSMGKQGEINFSGPASSGDASTSTPSADDVALVLHTSGTTSRPKRVPLTHRNLITSLRNVVDTYQLDESDVSLCIMPLFHVHGLVASTLSTFQSGGTVVVPLRFNPLHFWPVVKSHGVTWFS